MRRNKIRFILLLPLICLLALSILLGFYLWQLGSGQKSLDELPSALIDKPVPTFNLPPILGEGVALSEKDLGGQVSLVNVWASWCPPCRLEHKVLMKIADIGIPIFGINYKDTPEAATRFLKNLGNPFKAVGADRTGQTAIDWGVYGYPETFVVNKRGRIKYRHVGPLTEDDLHNQILPLIRRLQ